MSPLVLTFMPATTARSDRLTSFLVTEGGNAGAYECRYVSEFGGAG
jgi:hypothetical protein